MRLIDADALEPHEVYFNYGCQRIVYMDDIDEMPTIVAEPVIRCKDCRWFNDRLKRDGAEDNRYAPSICTLHGRPHSNTYFCADGEVKE